jgi:hypothetical protein
VSRACADLLSTHTIHRNSGRHGFVANSRDWPYSSCHAVCAAKPSHIRRAEASGWFAGLVIFDAARASTRNTASREPPIVEDWT